MSRRPQRQRRFGCLGLVGVLLLLVCGVAAALSALVLLAVRRPAGLALTVQLNAPATGAQAELNQPLGLEAVAASQAGVTRLELYADGALAAAQASSLPTGSNPLLFLQSWTPLTLGRHALVARAYDNTGLFADSNVVYIDVVALLDPTYQISTAALAYGPGLPLPSLNEVAASLGVDAQQLLDLNPRLAGGDPAAPLPPAESLTLPRTTAPSPPPTEAPSPLADLPAVPVGLAATLDCASAQLEWATADGVNQYAVYRLGPGDTAPQTLASVSGSTYTDVLPALGEYRYQVAALGPGGETLSPMVTAATPGTCVPPALPPGTVDLRLHALALETDAVFDGVYCYLSVDGSPFEGVPRGDFSFLLPGADGLRYDLPTQLPNHGQFILAAHPDSAPVRLTGDCWGRAGPLSIPLGAFVIEDPPTEWDGAQKQTRLLPAGANVALARGELAHAGAPALADARARLTYTLSAPPAAASAVVDPLGALVEAYGLPAPTQLRIENSTLACEELAQEDGRRRRREFDVNFPGLPGEDATGNRSPSPLTWLTETLRQSLTEQTICQLAVTLGGHPTLLWDWSDDTGRFREATLTGYHVEVQLTDLNRPQPTDFILQLPRFEPVVEGVYWQRDIHPGTRMATLARLIDVPCSVRLDYTVSAVAGGRQSVPSEALSFESEPCSNAARVTVEINTLVVGPVNDRGDPCPFDCSADTLEVVGYLFAGAGRWNSQRRWLSDVGEYRLVDRQEGRYRVYNTVVVRPPNPLNLVAAGRYNWADQWLDDVENGVSRGAWRGHQRWWLLATPTTTIPIGVRLDDWGDASGYKPFCYIDFEIPARRATVWHTTDETFTLRDTRGEASCEISVHIVGARLD